MSLNTKVGVFAGAAAVAFTATGFAGSTPSNTDARIAALESQIAELKTQSGSMLNDEQVRALVQEAIADSETRSSFLQGGSGYQAGKGFYLSNGDGTFDMWINAYNQTRAVVNTKDSPDEGTLGFEARRTRFIFAGGAGDVDYFVQWEWDADGNTNLLDAKAKWDMENGWALGWGQGKAPFLREQLMGADKQLAAERSYVHHIFTAGRTQGVGLGYMGDTMRFVVAFTDGMNNANSPFNADGTEWAFTARVDALLDGTDWNQFDDYTSWSTDNVGWLMGGAVHWQDGEYGTGDEETEVFAWTIDTQVEYGGANVAAYILGTHTNANSDLATDFDWYGFVLQGGYQLVPDKFEVFGRWEWIDFDGAAAEDEFNALTFGCNYYFSGSHQWKWTTDVIYALDSVPFSAEGLGLLADASGDEDQMVLRSQFQVSTR